MNWIFFSITSAATVALARILQKNILKDQNISSFSFSVFFNILVGGLFLLYTLVTGTLEFPSLNTVIGNMILMTLLYSLASVMTFYAFKESEASEVSIIFASSSIWSVLSAVLFLGEKITFTNVLGILLIVSSLVTINYTKSSWHLHRGHLYALIAALCYGLAFTNDVYILRVYDSLPSYIMIAFFLPALVVTCYKPTLLAGVKYFTNVNVLTKFTISAVLYATSAFCIYTAYAYGGKASVIGPIQQTSLIFTVIFSYIFLAERDKLLNKIIGMIFAFIGVLLLI